MANKTKQQIEPTPELKLDNIFFKLAEMLPEEGIERTKGQDTRKGYDTTNWVYQYYVNRLNEVLEDRWSFDWEILKEIQGKYRNGTPFWEITVAVTIFLSEKFPGRKNIGTHTSTNYGDALKGAITNGFKKTAAFWGVGWQAYAGKVDDDSILPDKDENKQYGKQKGDFQKAIKAIETLQDKKEAIKIQMLIEDRDWAPGEKTDLIKLLKAKTELL